MRAPLAVSLAAAALVLSPFPSLGAGIQSWTFTGVTNIRVESVSGDVTVIATKGSAIEVTLEENVSPAKSFHTEVEQDGKTLRLYEYWRGSSRGNVDWVISVPEKLTAKIEIKSSSGSLEAKGVKAKFRFRSSSGYVKLDRVDVLSGSSFQSSSGDLILMDSELGDDVELRTSSGDVEVSGTSVGDGFEIFTSSGDFTVKDSHGVLNGSSSSGNVHVYDTDLSGPSSFSSSSGDVIVVLSSMPEHKFEAASSSGMVRFQTHFGDNFTLIMSKRRDRGRISSPFDLTSEDVVVRSEQIYEREFVKRGSGKPQIRLRTASGSIVVQD